MKNAQQDEGGGVFGVSSKFHQMFRLNYLYFLTDFVVLAGVCNKKSVNAFT